MSVASLSIRLRRVAGRTLFGDRYGVVVFLSSLALFGLGWQGDVLITDTYTLANGLFSVTNGEAFLTEAAYGPELRTPGVESAPGGPIARNYGAIVLSVPVWLLLELLAGVADLRVALVGLWSLVLVALVVRVGRLREDSRIVVGGAAAVLALFVLNVAVAHPLDASMDHLYALQLFHLSVAAFGPVLLYRLTSRVATRRVALLSATLLLLGTPLTLWASVPKRHVLASTVLLGVMYALYRSHTADGESPLTRPVAFRASAYALVGLYAWVHAPEALLFLVVLAAVDVPTAADNSVRTLATVGGVFLAALVPFFLTNAVLVGSPLEPPRLLAVQGSGQLDAVGAGTATGPSTGGGGGGSSPLSVLSSALDPVRPVTMPLELLWGELLDGLAVFYTRPDLVYHTFVRSGSATAALNDAGTNSVNLSVLESAPVLLGLLAAPVTLWRGRDDWRTGLRSPARVVDLFAVALAVALTLQYASRLPLHAQLTVRYLFPLYPIGVYLLVRLPAVRRTLETEWRLFAWTAGAVLCIGSQLAVVVVYWTVAGLGGAFQFHGVLSLSVGAALGLWALVGRSDGRFGQVGAALLGATAALALLFVVLTVVVYYPLNNSHVVPVVQVLAELVDLF